MSAGAPGRAGALPHPGDPPARQLHQAGNRSRCFRQHLPHCSHPPAMTVSESPTGARQRPTTKTETYVPGIGSVPAGPEDRDLGLCSAIFGDRGGAFRCGEPGRCGAALQIVPGAAVTRPRSGIRPGRRGRGAGSAVLMSALRLCTPPGQLKGGAPGGPAVRVGDVVGAAGARRARPLRLAARWCRAGCRGPGPLVRPACSGSARPGASVTGWAGGPGCGSTRAPGGCR